MAEKHQVTGITIEADSVVIKGSDFDLLCGMARENEQLRGNLSLAEEGLANYAQEVKGLRDALEYIKRHSDGKSAAWSIADHALRVSEPQSGEHGLTP